MLRPQFLRGKEYCQGTILQHPASLLRSRVTLTRWRRQPRMARQDLDRHCHFVSTDLRATVGPAVSPGMLPTGTEDLGSALPALLVTFPRGGHLRLCEGLPDVQPNTSRFTRLLPDPSSLCPSRTAPGPTSRSNLSPDYQLLSGPLSSLPLSTGSARWPTSSLPSAKWTAQLMAQEQAKPPLPSAIASCPSTRWAEGVVVHLESSPQRGVQEVGAKVR